MKVIFKYENGAEEIAEMNSPVFPEVFHINMIEGCTFWFVFVDKLPSGALLFKETTQERAREIWSGE